MDKMIKRNHIVDFEYHGKHRRGIVDVVIRRSYSDKTGYMIVNVFGEGFKSFRFDKTSNLKVM